MWSPPGGPEGGRKRDRYLSMALREPLPSAASRQWQSDLPILGRPFSSRLRTLFRHLAMVSLTISMVTVSSFHAS